MPEIKIKVRDKCAEGEGVIICNNSDYTVVWDLDGEWTPYDTKTMRVNLADGTYQDVVFTGDTATLPVLTASGWVSVGLYAGDIHTSRAARLLALSSVLTPGGSPAAPAEDVYAQIMAKLNELSTVSPEDIAKAVEDYLAEHPAASASMRVEGGYIQFSSDGKTWENVIALADLKGAPGSPGSPGSPGKDGLTPHIGDNGNWYLGDTDTGKPARGAPGAKGDPGKDGAGMDVTGATVGQIAKISAVDDNGVPTAWEPVDMPSGGGSTWVKVYDGSSTIAEEISAFEVDLTKSDPMKEFQLWLKLDQNTAADWGKDKSIGVTVNGETIGYFIFQHRLNTYVEFYEERSIEAMTVAKRCMSPVNLSYNLTTPTWIVEQGVKRQNNGKLSIFFPAPYAGKITAKVYGRY